MSSLRRRRRAESADAAAAAAAATTSGGRGPGADRRNMDTFGAEGAASSGSDATSWRKAVAPPAKVGDNQPPMRVRLHMSTPVSAKAPGTVLLL